MFPFKAFKTEQFAYAYFFQSNEMILNCFLLFLILIVVNFGDSDVPDVLSDPSKIDILQKYCAKNVSWMFISSGNYYWQIPQGSLPCEFNARKTTRISVNLTHISLFTWYDRARVIRGFAGKSYQQVDQFCKRSKEKQFLILQVRLTNF